MYKKRQNNQPREKNFNAVKVSKTIYLGEKIPHYGYHKDPDLESRI